MKEALSLRYGGELIPATECDYRSFRDLGLLCPICRKTVFLVSKSERAEHERKTKKGEKVAVKSSCIPAHFHHHPDTESSMVELCELRSNQITETQRLAVVAKARGQRQKIFTRHFWRILCSSYRLTGIEQGVELFDQLFLQQFNSTGKTKGFSFEARVNSVRGRFLQEVTHAYRMKMKTMTREGILSLLDSLHTPERVDYLIETTGDTSIKNVYHSDMGELEKRLKADVVIEAMNFLAQPKQKQMLEDLARNATFSIVAFTANRTNPDGSVRIGADRKDEEFVHIYEALSMAINPGTAVWDRMIQMIGRIPKLDNKGWGQFVTCLITEIDMAVCTVDWAGKFEQFEDEFK